MPAGQHVQSAWVQKVPEDWVDAINESAAKEGCSRTEFVRRAIFDALPEDISDRLSEPQSGAARKAKPKNPYWHQWVPDDWLIAIDKHIKRLGMTRSAWVRQAIRRRLPKSKKVSPMRPPGNPNWINQ